MSKRGSRLAAVGAIGALALGIVACGDDEGSGSTSGSSGGDSGEKVQVGLITKTEIEPVLREDEGGGPGGRRREQRRADDRRRQDRHRRPDPDHGDGEHGHQGREGHPHHARAVQGDRAGDGEGARRRRDRHRARHAARAAGRRGRAVRDRQCEGRRADRRVGEGEVREGGQGGEGRHDRPRPGRLRRHPAPRRLPEGLRDHRQGSARPRRRRGQPGQGAGRDGEPAAEGPGRQPRLHDQRAVGVRRVLRR